MFTVQKPRTPKWCREHEAFMIINNRDGILVAIATRPTIIAALKVCRILNTYGLTCGRPANHSVVPTRDVQLG